jgi:hypothetical protein
MGQRQCRQNSKPDRYSRRGDVGQARMMKSAHERRPHLFEGRLVTCFDYVRVDPAAIALLISHTEAMQANEPDSANARLLIVTRSKNF